MEENTSEKELEGKQLRNFVFTWNNPWKFFERELTKEQVEHFRKEMTEVEAGFVLAHKYLTNLFESQKIPIKYITYGEEYGQKNRTPHLQGYCELSKRVLFTRVKSHFAACYICKRKGSQRQAIDYCRKGATNYSHGEPKIQGDRTDLQHITNMLVTSGSIKTLLDEEKITSMQELRIAEKMIRYVDKPRDYKPQVLWLHGASGLGKTRLARELLPDAYFKTSGAGMWWPSYDGHEDVIIDDLRPATYNYVTLLGLLDRYPFQVEDKGTIREFKGRRIIITTPNDPFGTYNDWCCLHGEKTDQLERRVDKVIHITVDSKKDHQGLILPPDD